MKIRKGNRNDLEKIILLLKQVSMLHIKMRPDIFKIKTKENIKAEAIEFINDKERIVIVAEENNCKRLELNCWEENYKAISFYEKQGMQTQRRIMEINI